MKDRLSLENFPYLSIMGLMMVINLWLLRGFSNWMTFILPTYLVEIIALAFIGWGTSTNGRAVDMDREETRFVLMACMVILNHIIVNYAQGFSFLIYITALLQVVFAVELIQKKSILSIDDFPLGMIYAHALLIIFAVYKTVISTGMEATWGMAMILVLIPRLTEEWKMHKKYPYLIYLAPIGALIALYIGMTNLDPFVPLSII